MDGTAAKPDFFISRTGADKAAAELIAGIVREAGLTPFYQDEDFGHADFMRMMEKGYEAAKLIVLLSEKYQQSEHCRKEYNTFLAHDPANLKQRVIVFRVSNCAPAGNLATLAYTDLVPVLNNCGALRQAVRETVRGALGFDAPAPGSLSSMLQRAGQQIRHPNIRAVKGFTGRDDMLDALAQKLAAKSSVAILNSSQTTLTMRGMGGVGKTVLAQEYAWRNRERYCGLWWVRAEVQDTLLDDLAALGARFIPGLPDKPEDAALQTVDQLAQMRSGNPWLLIYDNAEGPALLRRFTPADNAHVLITTRRTGWGDDADDELAVDVFDRDTAIAYLLKLARNGDADAAGRLADALHRLPLALSHARAYCSEFNVSFDGYAERLPELIAEAPEDAAYPRSVFASFTLAIEKAAAKCADAETLMALLAFFAPDKIPLWLIPEDVLPEKQREKALAALTSVSLAAYDSLPGGAPAVSVHRLVQEVMLGRLRNAGRFEETAAQAIRLIQASYDWSEFFESAPRNTAWLPHALAAVTPGPASGPAAWHTLWTLIQIGDFRVSRGELGPARRAYEAGLAIAERLAAADPGNARWRYDLGISNERIGDVQIAQGDLASALKSYEAKRDIISRLAAADPGNAGWQRDLSISHIKVGDVLVVQGQLKDALKAFRDSLAIAERLAAADPANAGWQRDLSVSHIKVGGVLVAQGQLKDALKAFRDSLAISERLAAADPGNAQWQRDLSVSHDRVGDVLVDQGQLKDALKAFGDSLAIRERLAAADPGNAGWQRDLSVSHSKVGDVLVAQGRLQDALKAFGDSLAIRERLAAADPGNAGWQRDLSVSHSKVGDVLVAQGRLQDALKAFGDSLAIRERLAAADPGNAGWQRDLSVSLNKVGDVLVAQGRLQDALKAFGDSLAIRERLAAADPGNAGWQRDLSVSHEKVGDVLVAQGRLQDALKAFGDSLAIAERLAAADPGNAGWQRDLSVSHEKVGDVLVAQGRLQDALKAFGDSLAIRERLAAADPGNAQWRYDLGISNERIGDVQMAQGDLASALKSYEAKRDIISRLAAADPGNAGWQRDLSVSHEKVGDVLVAQGRLQDALKAFGDSLAIRERLAAADPGNAGWQADLAASHGKLGQLYARMGDKAEARRMFERGRAIVAPFAEKSGHQGWIGYLRAFDEELAALGK